MKNKDVSLYHLVVTTAISAGSILVVIALAFAFIKYKALTNEANISKNAYAILAARSEAKEFTNKIEMSGTKESQKNKTKIAVIGSEMDNIKNDIGEIKNDISTLRTEQTTRHEELLKAIKEKQ